MEKLTVTLMVYLEPRFKIVHTRFLLQTSRISLLFVHHWTTRRTQYNIPVLPISYHQESVADHRPGLAEQRPQELSNDPPLCLAIFSSSTQLQEVHRAQRGDQKLRLLIDYIEGGPINASRPTTRRVCQQSTHYTVEDGLLYHHDTIDSSSTKLHQLVIPDTLKKHKLYAFPNVPLAAHLGRTKTYECLCQRFY